MWLFTRYGFFSVAVFRDLVVLRARNRLHLGNLRRRFRARIGRRQIAETRLKDYRWRLTLDMGAWLGLLAEIAGEQTWDNFKREAAAYGAADGDYLGLLYDLWVELVHYQNAPKSRARASLGFEFEKRYWKEVVAEDARARRSSLGGTRPPCSSRRPPTAGPTKSFFRASAWRSSRPGRDPTSRGVPGAAPWGSSSGPARTPLGPAPRAVGELLRYRLDRSATMDDALECPNCGYLIPARMVVKAGGKLAAALRARRAGPPKLKRPCPHCGALKGCRDLRRHLPRCRKNPRRGRVGRPRAG